MDGDVETLAAATHHDGIVRDRHRPDETRRQDAAGEIVDPRARTGLEEIDSYEGEGAVMPGAVGRQVVSRHDPHVVHHQEAMAVSSRRTSLQVRQRHRTVEVADRAGIRLRTL